MKILMVLNDIFGNGGVERVVATNSSFFVENLNYKVDICSLFRRGKKLNYYINDKVKLFDFKKLECSKMKRNIYLMKSLERLIVEEEYDIVIGCSSFIIFLLLFLKLKRCLKLKKIKIISWEHSQYNNVDNKSKILRKFFYKFLDGIVTLTKADEELFRKFCKKTRCIYNINPYKVDKISDLKSKNIIAVGRLEKEKGFETLITTFRKVVEKEKDWKLNIFGEGSQRNKLEKLINDLELKNKVKLEGFSPSIGEKYLSSSIFVMTSLSESFGMVLIEAMSFGVPCISFDCDSGPREIIINNSNGYLIKLGDVEALSEKILFLISNFEERERVRNEAIKNIDRYSKERILKEWKEYFEG